MGPRSRPPADHPELTSPQLAGTKRAAIQVRIVDPSPRVLRNWRNLWGLLRASDLAEQLSTTAGGSARAPHLCCRRGILVCLG